MRGPPPPTHLLRLSRRLNLSRHKDVYFSAKALLSRPRHRPRKTPPAAYYYHNRSEKVRRRNTTSVIQCQWRTVKHNIMRMHLRIHHNAHDSFTLIWSHTSPSRVEWELTFRTAVITTSPQFADNRNRSCKLHYTIRYLTEHLLFVLY